MDNKYNKLTTLIQLVRKLRDKLNNSHRND